MAAKSNVYKHYDILDHGKEGTYKAKCKCYSISISARGKTKSNLVTHIKVLILLKFKKKI